MKTISAPTLAQWLQDPDRLSPQLLDVREPWEYQICQIAGSLLLPMRELPARRDELDPQRPLVCREFLVTSAPVHCADPAAGRVDLVATPGTVASALCAQARRHTRNGWVPLVLALEWAEAHPLRERRRPGQELLREVVEAVTRRPVPASDPARKPTALLRVLP